MHEPDFTLSAGPTAASAGTLAALGSPVTYHYDPVFLERFRRTERKVAQILGTQADVVLMQGEAVLGLEAAARGALTIVDCVSSVGSVPFQADDWEFDICVLGPQKCLAGPPGMSLMSVSRRAWEAIEANPTAPRASFLSLLDWKAQWLEGG